MAITDTYFKFKDEMYQQTDGVATGSPLGPTLTNIFMCHHEQIWLNGCPSLLELVFYRRYINDTFLPF